MKAHPFFKDNPCGIGDTLLAAVIILVCTLAVYANSFKADFQFDDLHQVVYNQNIRGMDDLSRFFTKAGLGSYRTDSMGYRPLTYLSFALNFALSGNRVSGYHIFNFALHFINAFMVFLIVMAVLKEAGRGETFLAGLAVSLLFALHPIQTGAVTYVSGRAALLASMFYLFGFYGFLRFRRGSGKGPARGLWAALVPASYLAGLLAKEIAVSLPAAMLAYDFVFTFKNTNGASGALRKGLCYGPLLAVLVLYFTARRYVSGFFTGPELAYRVGDYLLSESRALLLYIRLLLLPINQNADYNIPVTESVDARVIVSVILVAAALYLLIRLRKTDPAAAFFGFWSFIALSPESTLVPITDIAVEYRLYLPSVGFIALSALLAGRLARNPAFRKAAAVAVLVTFGVLTAARNEVWASKYTLWSDVAKKTPGSVRAHANLGQALIGEKRYGEAMTELGRCLEMDPLHPLVHLVHYNIGVCLMETGREDEALEEFNMAIKAEPGFVEAYGGMGAIYYKAGRYKEAADVLEKAVRLNPGFAQSRYSLGMSYAKLGRDSEALAELREALRYSPKQYDVRYNLAVAYDKNAMPADALEQARAALDMASGEARRREAGALVGRLEGRARGAGVSKGKAVEGK